MEETINIKYSDQPTLIIGLGGIGSNIAYRIHKKMKSTNIVSTFCIDTDLYPRFQNKDSSITQINISNYDCTISDYINHFSPSEIEWFPSNQLLINKSMAEGSGSIRSLARLLYENAINKNKFKLLLDEASNIAKTCAINKTRMRVSIITSLCGGTGSGIFLQIAALVRNYINKLFPSLNIKIHGEFIMPGYFKFISSHAEMNNLEANAYASLKELNAINESFFANAPPIKLKYTVDTDSTYFSCLPFDYCFLYGCMNSNDLDEEIICNSVYERLFGPASNIINEKFVNNLRYSTRKNSANIYGLFSMSFFDTSDEFRIGNLYDEIKQSNQENNNIYICYNNKDNEVYDLHNMFALDNHCFEKTTVISFKFNINLSDFTVLKNGTGQYFRAYSMLINNIPPSITPHLDKNWHISLHDIGTSANYITSEFKSHDTPHATNEKYIQKNTEKAIFISYSSKDESIAKQTKKILEDNGIKCWMAPQSIPPGSDYGAEIPIAIEKCGIFVLLLSEFSQKSNWVPKEVGLAIGQNKIIIPFQIDNADISASFNFYLTNNQRILAYRRMADAYKDLIKRIKDLLCD